uniref:Nucleophile aminohydrolase n=1 Tax=Ascaris lumbricoides TaxID=6252 RepID=A0A0M3HU82_ASCLU
MNRKKRGKRKGPYSSNTRLTAGSVVPKTSATKDCGDARTERSETQGSATSTHTGNVLTAKDRELATVAIKLMVSRIRRDGGFIALSQEAEALTEGMMAERVIFPDLFIIGLVFFVRGGTYVYQKDMAKETTINSAKLAHVSVGVAIAMDKLLATINTGSYNAILLSLMFDGSVTLHEACKRRKMSSRLNYPFSKNHLQDLWYTSNRMVFV